MATFREQQLLHRKSLFDHVGGGYEQGLRYSKIKSLHGLYIDIRFDFGCLLDRQIGGICAFENAAYVDAHLRGPTIRSCRA